MAQKLIIPRGLIDPEETTVINVPNDLRGSSVVIAKKSPGSPEASGQGSFYTPPPQKKEFPSLDYPAFMSFNSPEFPSFYRIHDKGENWSDSRGPMPKRIVKTPTRKPLQGPDYPTYWWSPAKRSTPVHQVPFHVDYSTKGLFTPTKRFGPLASPIDERRASQYTTIQPAYREFPTTIPSRRESQRTEYGMMDSDEEEEEEEDEEEEAEVEEVAEERMHALDQLEFSENDTIIQDLLAMQRERRKVVYDMANMAPTRKSSLRKLLAPFKALKKFKAKLKKKNKVAPMPQ